MRNCVLLSLFLAGISTVSAAENPVAFTEQATVELVSEKEAVSPGGTQWIGILFKPKAGWHVYWKNPGDSGLPPRVEFGSNPGGSRFGMLEFATPDRVTYGPVVNFAYEGDTLYPVRWVAPESLSVGESVTITANLKWLICKEECVPGRAQLSLRLPVETAERLATIRGTHSGLFASTLAALPAEEKGSVRLALVPDADGKDRVEIFYSGKLPRGARRTAFFFPEGEYGIPSDTKQKVEETPDGLKVSIPRKEKKPIGEIRGVLKLAEGRGVLVSQVIDRNLIAQASGNPVMKGNSDGAISPQANHLGWMLLFAFVGGLILNLMPCILPVLSIKVMEIANQAGSRQREIRAHGLVYTFGIMFSFWILAAILLIVRAGGTTLGWGFQLQSPIFIAVLAVLFFVMGLNLFGFFEIGGRWMGFGGKLADREGYVGSFFTGVLTTVAATPCSAPFMGTALGFAVTQSASVAILVLSFLGFGLAFPYLVFSHLPAAARILPRPGAWMKTMKEFLAFPLFGTVIWLVSVLGNQTGVEGVFRILFALLLVSAALWFFGWKTEKIIPKTAAISLAIISLVISFGLIEGLAQLRMAEMKEKTTRSSLVKAPWREWSQELLDKSLAENKTVLVNLTADWCVTCKVNEVMVFDRDSVKQAISSDGIVALLGDWTNGDPKITEYMMKYGRNSVPVYLLYKNGSRDPKILPQILTAELILKELK